MMAAFWKVCTVDIDAAKHDAHLPGTYIYKPACNWHLLACGGQGERALLPEQGLADTTTPATHSWHAKETLRVCQAVACKLLVALLAVMARLVLQTQRHALSYTTGCVDTDCHLHPQSGPGDVRLSTDPLQASRDFTPP